MIAAALAAAMLTALASPSALAAAPSVLTFSGTNAAVGDAIASSGTASITMLSSSSGTATCAVSVSGTIQSNPPAPGTATASVASMGLANCGGSAHFANLPYVMPITSGTSGATVQITGNASNDMALFIQVPALTGTIFCGYHAKLLTGTVSKSGSLQFGGTMSEMDISPPAPCGRSVSFSASFSQVVDTTQGQPLNTN
jgi:hypothetical protein